MRDGGDCCWTISEVISLGIGNAAWVMVVIATVLESVNRSVTLAKWIWTVAVVTRKRVA